MNHSSQKVFLQYKANYLEYLKAKNGLVRFDCYCNICGYRFEKFLEFCDRKNALCPVCGSLERHRHLFVHLHSMYPFLENKKILHFAPEQIIKDILSCSKAEYFDADISPGRATYQMDIIDIPSEDAFFDYVIAIHVLEHIPDDYKAMAQIFRVLKTGGVAILAVPAKATGETEEDKTATTPEDRLRLYGEAAHVRRYSFTDFCSRLEQTGFSLKISRSQNFLDHFQLESNFGNNIGDDIVFATKP
jgi:SAM-dependent methyltransferase